MNIYVQNDFVFSSSACGNASSSSLVCGLSQIDPPLQHTGTYDTLYNKYLHMYKYLPAIFSCMIFFPDLFGQILLRQISITLLILRVIHY